MSITIQNTHLTVSIHEKGAELYSIRHRLHDLEYMWSGDPAFWGKTSPVLFPIVGTLKNNTYYYNDKAYTLSRHGFARDHVFEVEEQTSDSAVFLLRSQEEMLTRYPFPFELRIRYALLEDSLQVAYAVTNTGSATMYFSLGAHPAFRVPMVAGTQYEDHYLAFTLTEDTPHWPISAQGLLETTPQPFLQKTNRITLQHKLFENDAIVLKDLRSDVISLRSDKHAHGLDFTYTEFPYIGLWAAPGADFVCIEPWCGIADSVDTNQQLTVKEGIEQLEAGREWSRRWTARFY
jgi:galactose mutarotase-like enzyme